MADVSLSILGLGRLGTSVGLALKRYNAQNTGQTFKITGYDSDVQRSKDAKRIGAVDAVKPRPAEAARDQDVVIMAMPYGEVYRAYDHISGALRQGSVVLDLAMLKQNSIDAAEKFMPEGAYLVCATPVVNPRYLFDSVDETQRASEDYFNGGMMMLMPGVQCPEEAIKLSRDLSAILGAEPHFFDPHEHDALAANVELLPMALSVAYFQMLRGSDGWDDMQRLSNPAFGTLSRVFYDTHPDDILQLLMDDGEPLVRSLTAYIDHLTDLRDMIANKRGHELSNLLNDQSKAYSDWINRRHNNNWQDTSGSAEIPTAGENIGTRLFGNIFRRKNAKDDE